MSVSPCSIAFGYDEFYVGYLNVPFHRGLLERSLTRLPHPAHFSSLNPQDCCVLALHGHVIFPHDEISAKKRVEPGGSYEKTIAARMKLFEDLVGEFNALQERMKYESGGAITVVLDDGPVLDASFPLADFGGEEIEKAAPQYEVDRKFSSLGHSGRLNHFAREYGFANFQKFQEYLGLLDEEAKRLGFPSYGAICVPTRYLDHVQSELTANNEMRSTLAELREKRDLLQQQTVFTIERFLACRRAGEAKDFFVDVSKEGVLISLHDGPLTTIGIVSSVHLSDRNDEFHRKWFDC